MNGSPVCPQLKVAPESATIYGKIPLSTFCLISLASSFFFLLLNCILLLVLFCDAYTILLIYSGSSTHSVSGVLHNLFSVVWTILASIWLLLLTLLNLWCLDSLSLPAPPVLLCLFFFCHYTMADGVVCSFPMCSMHCCLINPTLAIVAPFLFLALPSIVSGSFSSLLLLGACNCQFVKQGFACDHEPFNLFLLFLHHGD